MVAETYYYDQLGVSPTATDLEIKKAYRKMAITHHPDKNPDDPTAHEKFQVIGEAYQVLKDPDLRAAYDKHGRAASLPSDGFVDPSEFFSSIFGGDAFVEWIGEISLVKDLTETMKITTDGGDETGDEEGAGAGAGDGDDVFPGTEEALKESLKTAEAEPERHVKVPPPKATVADEGNAAEEVEYHVKVMPPTASVDNEGERMEGAGHVKVSSASGAASLGETDEHHIKPSGSSSTPTPAASTSNLSDQSSPTPAGGSGPNTPRSRTAIPIRPAIMDRPSDSVGGGGSEDGREAKDVKKNGKKKAGLTKEQREQLLALERERERVRRERVDVLARKLVDRVSVWTETDRGVDVTRAFQEKIRLEVEGLKMESFGLDILHAIGQIYVAKATALLRSQKLFGMGGLFGRIREKGTLVKDTWNTISSAIDAQNTMEEMARMEERGGDEWTEEKKTEYERRVTGKILNAAWRGSKFEIQSVLRDVCDAVLNDKKVPLSKRLERAEALVVIGDMCSKASRTPEEEGDYMLFEQLVAEAAMKKEKDRESKKKNKERRGLFTGASRKPGEPSSVGGDDDGESPQAFDAGAAEAPSGPKA